MESYFIVSFPGNPDPKNTFDDLKRILSGVEPVYDLSIPELKVGNLDNLLNVADYVEKVDSYFQQVAFKLEKQLVEFKQIDSVPKIGERLTFTFKAFISACYF